MTRYTLTYELPPEMLTRAMMSWAKPQLTRAQKWLRFGKGFVFYIVLVALTLALLRTGFVTKQTLLGFAAGIIGTLAAWAVFHHFNTGKLMDMVLAAHARHGPVDVVFCEDHVEIVSRISTGRMQWLCFDRIGRIEGATVLWTGGMAYAVPDAALPEDVTADMFRADLTTWMEAAR